MDASLWSTFSALFGALVGGGISYVLNRQQFRHQLQLSQDSTAPSSWPRKRRGTS